MKTINYVIAMSLLIHTANVSAQKLSAAERGNGGVIAECPGGVLEPLDYNETKVFPDLSTLKPKLPSAPAGLGYPSNVLNIAHQVLDNAERNLLRVPLGSHSLYIEKIREYVNSFYGEVAIISGVLPNTADAERAAVEEGCTPIQLIIQKKPTTYDAKLYTIRKIYWEKLTPEMEAGMILHEAMLRLSMEAKTKDEIEKDDVAPAKKKNILLGYASNSTGSEDARRLNALFVSDYSIANRGLVFSILDNFGFSDLVMDYHGMSIALGSLEFNASKQLISAKLAAAASLRVGPEQRVFLPGMISFHANGSVKCGTEKLADLKNNKIAENLDEWLLKNQKRETPTAEVCYDQHGSWTSVFATDLRGIAHEISMGGARLNAFFQYGYSLEKHAKSSSPILSGMSFYFTPKTEFFALETQEYSLDFMLKKSDAVWSKFWGGKIGDNYSAFHRAGMDTQGRLRFLDAVSYQEYKVHVGQNDYWVGTGSGEGILWGGRKTSTCKTSMYPFTSRRAGKTELPEEILKLNGWKDSSHLEGIYKMGMLVPTLVFDYDHHDQPYLKAAILSRGAKGYPACSLVEFDRDGKITRKVMQLKKAK